MVVVVANVSRLGLQWVLWVTECMGRMHGWTVRVSVYCMVVRELRRCLELYYHQN